MSESPKPPVTLTTNELVSKMVDKIKRTSADVCQKGVGELTFTEEEMGNALDLLLFASDEAVAAASQANLIIPQQNTAGLKLKLTLSGKPTIAFAGGPLARVNAPSVNQVGVVGENAVVSLGMHGAQPKDFPVATFTMQLANKHSPSSGQRFPGQIAVVKLMMQPDHPISAIPGIQGHEEALAPEKNIGSLMRWVLDDNNVMTPIHNQACPIIAANGPEHATTKVQGVEADINTNGITFRFYRDRFIRQLSRSIYPQKTEPFVFKKA